MATDPHLSDAQIADVSMKVYGSDRQHLADFREEALKKALTEASALATAQSERLAQAEAALRQQIARNDALCEGYEAEVRQRNQQLTAQAERIAHLETTLESEAFYDAMQAYRHCPLLPPERVVAAFEQVKAFIRAALIDLSSPSPAPPERTV